SVPEPFLDAEGVRGSNPLPTNSFRASRGFVAIPGYVTVGRSDPSINALLGRSPEVPSKGSGFRGPLSEWDENYESDRCLWYRARLQGNGQPLVVGAARVHG